MSTVEGLLELPPELIGLEKVPVDLDAPLKVLTKSEVEPLLKNNKYLYTTPIAVVKDSSQAGYPGQRIANASNIVAMNGVAIAQILLNPVLYTDQIYAFKMLIGTGSSTKILCDQAIFLVGFYQLLFLQYISGWGLERFATKITDSFKKKFDTVAKLVRNDTLFGIDSGEFNRRIWHILGTDRQFDCVAAIRLGPDALLRKFVEARMEPDACVLEISGAPWQAGESACHQKGLVDESRPEEMAGGLAPEKIERALPQVEPEEEQEHIELPEGTEAPTESHQWLIGGKPSSEYTIPSAAAALATLGDGAQAQPIDFLQRFGIPDELQAPAAAAPAAPAEAGSKELCSEPAVAQGELALRISDGLHQPTAAAATKELCAEPAVAQGELALRISDGLCQAPATVSGTELGARIAAGIAAAAAAAQAKAALASPLQYIGSKIVLLPEDPVKDTKEFIKFLQIHSANIQQIENQLDTDIEEYERIGPQLTDLNGMKNHIKNLFRKWVVLKLSGKPERPSKNKLREFRNFAFTNRGKPRTETYEVYRYAQSADDASNTGKWEEYTN